MGLLHQLQQLEPSKVPSILTRSPKGMREGRVEEGSWERGPGHPTPGPLSSGTTMSLMRWGGRPGVRSWKEAGTPQGLEPWPSSAGCATTSAFCFFLLFFHRLKGEKQNLNAAMSRIQ